MPTDSISDWELWNSLAICRSPLRLILDETKLKNRNQMKEFSGSAYVFRMFDLLFCLRWPGVSEKLTEKEKKDLASFTTAFDALPWRPLPAHPHISELPDDDFSALFTPAKKLDHRLWLRTSLTPIPCIYRLCRGWRVFEPSTEKENGANKRPEGTEGQCPPSKHSQPPSVPHP